MSLSAILSSRPGIITIISWHDLFLELDYYRTGGQFFDADMLASVAKIHRHILVHHFDSTPVSNSLAA